MHMRLGSMPPFFTKCTRIDAVLASSFTTFYAFLRLFDSYAVWANYVCSGLIQENK